MLDVVFAIQSGDVRATERALAGVAKKVESAEVVCLAQRVLIWWLIRNREELGGYNLVAVLNRVSIGLTRVWMNNALT